MCVCVSSRLVCQVLVTVGAPTVYMCLDEEELPRKSQILSLKMNHCVCFCCVNKSHCVTFVFLLPFLSCLLDVWL